MFILTEIKCIRSLFESAPLLLANKLVFGLPTFPGNGVILADESRVFISVLVCRSDIITSIYTMYFQSQLIKKEETKLSSLAQNFYSAISLLLSKPNKIKINSVLSIDNCYIEQRNKACCSTTHRNAS